MRKTHTGLLLSALIGVPALVAASSASQAQDFVNTGTYVSIAGGLSHPTTMDMALRNPITAAPVDRSVHFDTGYMFSGAVGQKWDNGFRTELEASYRKSDVNALNTATWTGSQKVLSLMGNALYDFGTPGRLTFSAGGGVGVGRNKWDTVTAAAAGSPTFNASDTNLQWQAIGEVSLPVGRQMALFADYRYITLYDNRFFSTTGAARISAGTDRSHNVLVGLRYFFG